jgi:hypothetical protein
MNMRNISFLLLLLCFTPFSSKAQKFEFNGDFLLFREARTKQPVLIINDSLVYKGNAMKQIAFKHTEYLDKLQEYVYFNIGAKTYLVHKGCGPVLEYRNDSIVRINDNYLQRNQYGAVNFVYNNEIYFFGGYGLFTFKNILTKYIFKNQDWIEVQTHGEIPTPRDGAFSFIKGNDIYIFGGATKDNNSIPNSKPLDNKVWRLHLPTMQWNCVGTCSPNLMRSEIDNVVADSKKLYFQGNDFFEFNYYKNKINIYNRNYFSFMLASYIEGNVIHGVYSVGSKKFYQKNYINELKGNLKSTTDFIKPIVNYNFYIKVVSLFLLAFILFLYLNRTSLKSIFNPFKGIVYDQQKQIFLYRGKTILIFEDQDKKILVYLLDHLNEYVSLNDLNKLFENNNGVETISAIVKRREQAINNLLAKVSKITSIDEKKLILERKNSDDKRIKDILLLPSLLKKASKK